MASQEPAQFETGPLIFEKCFLPVINEFMISCHPYSFGIVIKCPHKPILRISVNDHQKHKIVFLLSIVMKKLLIALHAFGQVILKFNRDSLSANIENAVRNRVQMVSRSKEP